MKKILLLFVLGMTSVFAQDKPKYKQAALTIGMGQNIKEHHLTLGADAYDFKDMAQVGIQLDAFKGAFVLGPEVRMMIGSGDKRFPVGTWGGVIGYDNDKFRLVATAGGIASNEISDYTKPTDVFQGIAGAELGYRGLYVRADWYTNLHTFFYSYAYSAGFRIKF